MRKHWKAALVAVAALAGTGAAHAQGWEPTKPVEFVIPAGPGGGADQMARFIQGIVTKHKLMKQPLIPINKSGGAGAEAFIEMQTAKDPHKIIITLSNLFTTPLGTNIKFSWKELTPVSMLALDQFILWVHNDTPYKTAKDYLEAVKAAEDKKMKMGGTGAKQEDQIITVALDRLTAPKKLNYISYKGGGEVAVQLVGKHVDSTVNNPIEAVAQWKGGSLRPLCIFDSQRSTYKTKVTATMSWADIPTCKEQGVDIEYLMLRGIFTTPGATKEQVAYYVDLFKKVMETPEWKQFMEDGAFKQEAMTGPDYVKWLEAAEKHHHALMKEAGFLAPGK